MRLKKMDAMSLTAQINTIYNFSKKIENFKLF